jgi:hypothetical protein|tara:strand:- start:17297 stop:17851 length:555 start_codon:yes stop_codon:yes gene_type:complete
MKKIPSYKVIKDTREQDGWFFSPYDKCSGMEVGTLHTGDYTLEGFEDIVCIERKASVSEIAMNLGKKKKAFYNEIERMRDFQFRYILLEFSASDLINYPLSLLKSEEDKEIYRLFKEDNARLPNYKRFDVVRQTKITGRYLLKSLMEISLHYDVNVMFCDNKHNAFMICNSIFKRLNESFHKEQ